MICGSPKQEKKKERIYTAIDFVLLMLGLLLDHQQRMIKEIYQQVPAIPLRTSALIQSTFIHKLPGRIL